MKKLILILPLCAAFAASEIPKHPRDLRFPALEYQPAKAADYHHKLASGASAYVVEDHALPLVSITVLVRTGSYLDPAGKAGLAAMTAGQMRGGGTASRTPEQFDDEVDFLAAQLMSGAGPVEATAHLGCMKKDLDQALPLFTEMLRSPRFDEGRLKLARNQMLQGLERRNDSTQSIEAREYVRLMRGPNHFTARQVTKASVESITRQDLVDFHHRYYFPANFIIAVSGDVDTAAILKRLDAALNGWASGAKAPLPPPPEFEPAPGIYIVDKDVNQGRVRMGQLGVTMKNPDHLALSIMNGILGGSGFTSRIMSRVRSDEGLAYQAASQFDHLDYYPGAFTALFQSKNASVAQAIALVRDEIDRIRREPVSQEEFATEVAHAIESLPRRFASAGLKAGQFAADEYRGLPEDYWQTYRQRLRALTPAELQRVAQKYLTPDKMVILVVGKADDILKGNPDKPQFMLSQFGEPKRIQLPDPLTMEYPK